MVKETKASREAAKFNTYLKLIAQGRPRDFARKIAGLTHAAVVRYATAVFEEQMRILDDEEKAKQAAGTPAGEPVPTT